MRKIKENRPFHIFWIFLIVALALMVGGTATLINAISQKNNYVKISTRISDVNRYVDDEGEVKYNVYVDYTFEGKEYEDVKLGSYSSRMEEGQVKYVFCNKNNPRKIVSNKNSLFIAPIALMAFGLIFMAVSIIPLIKHYKRKNMHENVKESGTKIKCYITEVELDTSYKVNDEYVNEIIHCKSVDSSQTQLYKSEPFKKGSGLKVNDIVYVYVNSSNSEEYWVDLNSYTGEQYLQGETKTDLVEKTKPIVEEDTVCEFCGTQYTGSKSKCPNCGASKK